MRRPETTNSPRVGECQPPTLARDVLLPLQRNLQQRTSDGPARQLGIHRSSREHAKSSIQRREELEIHQLGLENWSGTKMCICFCWIEDVDETNKLEGDL